MLKIWSEYELELFNQLSKYIFRESTNQFVE